MDALEIIKYDNRKLYLKNKKRYTTVKELAGFIRNGESIKVTTLKNEDVTMQVLRKVLTQKVIDLKEQDVYTLIRG